MSSCCSLPPFTSCPLVWPSLPVSYEYGGEEWGYFDLLYHDLSVEPSSESDDLCPVTFYGNLPRYGGIFRVQDCRWGGCHRDVLPRSAGSRRGRDSLRFPASGWPSLLSVMPFTPWGQRRERGRPSIKRVRPLLKVRYPFRKMYERNCKVTVMEVYNRSGYQCWGSCVIVCVSVREKEKGTVLSFLQGQESHFPHSLLP